MDPDIVKDMRERQDKMYNLQSSIQNGDFSAYVFFTHYIPSSRRNTNFDHGSL